MNQPIDNSGVGQQLENSQVHGGIQTTQGDKNVQVHGQGNVLTFNQTEILQISREEIRTRELITTSPYKGLKQFESRDKELFFGRDNFITTLVNELEHTNLVLLLGGSGSGKSSVVRAGLIPWLEKKYGTGFINLMITPDADPFDSFYASLLNNYSQKSAKIAREVKADTLIQVVDNLQQPDEFWFIFIDQFEELFTISDENKRREFIDGLIKLSQAKSSSINNLKIIATMRADFLERLSDFPQLVEATQKHRPMIMEMQPHQLRLAIEQPAAHHGVVFEAGLVDQIIAGIVGQAGYLPLLQYTLNLIWQHEVNTGSINDRTLKISTYENLGGVRGALQQHVNYIYEKLSPSQKLASQRIFLKLVGIAENAESGIEWKPIRRRAGISEFEDDERDVLLKLVNENLLVSNAQKSKTDSKKGLFGNSNSDKSDSTIEIAHEILLTCWDKLHNWIKKNRQGIAIRNRLYEDVSVWQSQNQPEDELWTGSKLEQVLELRKDDNFNQVLAGFNAEANQFIDASVGLRDRKLIRTRIIAGIGFTLAGLTTLASVFGFIQQQQAQKQEQQARKQSVISMTQTAESLLFTNNQLLDPIVKAIKAKKELDNLSMGKNIVSLEEQIEGKLQEAVYSLREHNRLQGYQRPVRTVVFSPDGQQLATSGDDGTASLWDFQGKELHRFERHKGPVRRIKYSPSNKLVATAGDDGMLCLWNLQGELVKEWNAKQGRLWEIKFSPNGQFLASVGDDGIARLWNLQGNLSLELKAHQKSLTSVNFSPNGELIATGSNNGSILLWNFQGKQLNQIAGHKGFVTSLSFSPDAQVFATTGEDGFVRLWNPRSKQPLKEWNAQQRKLWDVVFSPSGEQLATAGGDGTVRVWNSQGKELEKFFAHQGPARSVSFSPNGQKLASSSDDSMVRIWDLQGRELKKFEHKNYPSSVSLSTNGQQILSGDKNGTIRLWNLQGQDIEKSYKYLGVLKSLALSLDGQQIVTAGEDATIRSWNLQGQEIGKSFKHSDAVASLALSRNGQQIVVGGENGTIFLRNLHGLQQEKTFEGHLGAVKSVALSPDEKQIVSGGEDGTIRLWNLETQQRRIFQISGQITSVIFSPDNKRIISGDNKGRVILWNLQDSTERLPLAKWQTQQSTLTSIALSPDGKLLTTVGSDNSVKLWPIKSSDELMKQACNLVRHYLKNNPNFDENDKNLCDGVSS